MVRNAMYGVASPAVANREAEKLCKYSPLLALGISTNEKLRKPAVAKPVFFPAVVEDGGQFGDGLFKLIEWMATAVKTGARKRGERPDGVTPAQMEAGFSHEHQG